MNLGHTPPPPLPPSLKYVSGAPGLESGVSHIGYRLVQCEQVLNRPLQK